MTQPAKFQLLIDTCVWLDVAKDHRQAPLLAVLEELISTGAVSLIVPPIVLAEFLRNKERIAKESVKSLSSHVRLVKDAVERVGGDKRSTKRALAILDDVDHRIPIIGGHAVGVLDRIERLLRGGISQAASEDVAARAVQRALNKKAPFHRNKNSMADALLIETYAAVVRQSPSRSRFGFVTLNKLDFSIDGGDQQLPHPDFSGIFSRIKSLYFISLPTALRRVDPRLVGELLRAHAWVEEPRGLTEILSALDLLFHQVWYNRHQNLRIRVERGMTKVVDVETYPRPTGKDTVQKDVWAGALRAARRVEKRYGKDNLGPWDDFEWGMLNGKLSALRWALGDEWDMLDT